MKITQVEAIPMQMGPMIVRVSTDEGMDGLGECSGRNWKVLKPFIEEILQSLVVGKDPRLTTRLWEDMFFATSRLGPMGLQTTGIGAVDIACWDLYGKAEGRPLHGTGLGWSLQPDEMRAKVEQGLEIGIKAFKIRMDWNANRQDANPEKDYQMFKMCREFLPDEIALSFDANNGYSVSTAIHQGKRFEDLGLAHFEEPLPQYDYAGLKQVAEALMAPVSSGEQEHTRWQFRDLILQGNPDIVQPDIVMAGGISEMRHIYTLAETFNKPIMPHCPSAGISNAASLQLYCTVANAVRPHEYSYEFSPKDNMVALFEEPYELEDGALRIPDRPGHGLVLNEDALQHLRLQ